MKNKGNEEKSGKKRPSPETGQDPEGRELPVPEIDPKELMQFYVEALDRNKELKGLNDELEKRLKLVMEDLEMHIRRDELNYHALFETMAEGVVLHQMVYDDKGKAVDYLVRDVNPSFEKIFGIPAFRARGTMGSQLYHATPPPYLDIYEEVVKTGNPYYFKTYYPPIDCHFEISIFTPRRNLIAAIFLDVTGYHNSQEELRKAKMEASFLSDLLENSSQPFTISKLDGRIERVNQAFTALTGYSREELKSMHWSHDLSPEAWHAEDETKSQKLLKTGLPVRYEKEFMHHDGQLIQVEVFRHLARDDKGRPEFYYSFVTDITNRKRAEEELKNINKFLEEKVAERTHDLENKVAELNKSRKELLRMVDDLNRTSHKLKNTQEELVRKERLAILGEFSGNISHELRNPLGVIDSSIYFLQMSMKDKDEKTKQHLGRIGKSVKESIAIIDNLLNLTRMNKPVLSRHNLAELITECMDSLAIPAEVSVGTDFPGKPIFILAENIQVKMVVNNLVQNAVAAMDGEGTLNIRIREISDELVELSFTDSGSGIPEENLEKIFQPLFSTKAKGIGLGLSITKMIVENHGGKIHAESAPGKGSRFIIRVPVINEQKEVNNDLKEG